MNITKEVTKMTNRKFELSFKGRADTIIKLMSSNEENLKGVPHQESDLEVTFRLEAPEESINDFLRNMFRSCEGK